MSNIVPFNAAQLPAKAQQRIAAGQGIAQHMTDGVGSPMDFLSIKGKNFRERIQGEEIVTPRPLYEYDVVILDATPNLNKTYYIDPFKEGTMSPPDCWSLNSVKPDPGAPNKQSTTCRGCKWNVFGSRVSDRAGQPSKAKACADSRRIAVFAAYKLGHDVAPMLLRVPATSLKALKEYAVNLERQGIPANAVVTRMGFDQEPHPQLNFAVVGMLDDAQYEQIDWLIRKETLADGTEQYADERLRRILEAPMQEEEVDPSELAGNQITNRGQAPAPVVSAAAPSAGQWVPPGQQAAQVPQAAPVAPQAVPVAAAAPVAATPTQAAVAAPEQGLITLPDGQVFNPLTGQYVVKEEPKDVIINLPDGKKFNQTTGKFVEEVAPRATEAQAIPAPAKPVQAIPTSVAAAPKAAIATGGGWTPVAPGPVTNGQWVQANPMPEGTPSFLQKDKSVQGPTMDLTAVEVVAEEAAPAPKPKPRKTTPAPSTAAAPDGAAQAPASLDALLEGLDLAST